MVACLAAVQYYRVNTLGSLRIIRVLRPIFWNLYEWVSRLDKNRIATLQKRKKTKEKLKLPPIIS